MADKFNFGGRVELIQGGLSEGTASEGNLYSAKFRNEFRAGQSVAKYIVYIWADVRNYKENPDGSIELDFYGVSQFRVRTYEALNITTASVTYTLNADMKNDGNLVQVWQQALDLSSSFDTGDIFVTDKGSTPKHYKVNAGQTLNIPEIKVAHWLADASVADDEFNLYIGGSITNTNPANYRPYAEYQGAWKDFNSNNGHIQIYLNGAWVDKSLENANTIKQPNTGHNRIYLNGQWLQAPPMKGGNANG